MKRLIPFDKQSVAALLATLDHRKLAAFSLSCCERLLPNYEAFFIESGFGDINAIRSLCETMWQFVLQGNNNLAPLREIEASLLELTPDSYAGFGSSFVGMAQNCADAVLSSAKCVYHGSLESAVSASLNSQNSLFSYLVWVNGTATQATLSCAIPGEYDYVNRLPILEAELLKQYDDVKLLQSKRIPTEDVLVALRTEGALGIQPIRRGLVRKPG